MNALQALRTAALSSVRRRGVRWLISATLAAVAACSSGHSNAGEIPLSQFTGQETVINIGEIPGGGLQGSAVTPADNWSRTVYGVKFNGGKDFFLGGRLGPSSELSNPFRSPPTSGDPNGFSRASLGSYLSMFLPLGFNLDFSALSEMPKRLGLNVAAGATLRTTLTFSDASTADYVYDAPVQRLIAYESGVPISRIQFSWVNGFIGDGSDMTIDDVRFEPVPEPSTCGLAVAGLAVAAFVASRRKVAAG